MAIRPRDAGIALVGGFVLFYMPIRALVGWIRSHGLVAYWGSEAAWARVLLIIALLGWLAYFAFIGFALVASNKRDRGS